ncbi:MAG: DUF1461 domain-containing protein [Coriobacteriia bacterium]|nr:DUF1461 domain-containing protein [Coriobacteriia bacterium]
MSAAARSALVAVSSVLVVAGLAVALLLTPGFVRFGVAAADAPALRELGRSSALQAAEAARRYVAGRGDRLAADAGFDAATSDHLADVRGVVAGVRWTAVVSLVCLANLLAHAVSHGTQFEVARGLRWGGRASLALAIGAAALGAADFTTAFVAFHKVFFPQGGWVFPDDALIIRLFPERFWALAGAGLLALLAAGGAVLLLGAAFVRKALDEQPASATGAPLGD